MKSNRKKIGIVIPVHDCLELTKNMLGSIHTSYPYQVYFIDDHSNSATKAWLANQDATLLTDPLLSTGLASNWNLGISAALNDGCTHILVANNDILLHPQAIDLMVARLEQGDILLVTARDVSSDCQMPQNIFKMSPGTPGEEEHPHFSCFMLTEETIRRVGWFDEGYLGAYYEDNDYHATIAMAHEKAIVLHQALFYHYGRRTIAEHPDEVPALQQKASLNRSYFIQKWGKMPVDDVEDMRSLYYPYPFNRLIMGDSISVRMDYLFQRAKQTGVDIREHLDYIYRLASSVDHITEFTSGTYQATCALLYSRPKHLVSYGYIPSTVSPILHTASYFAKINFESHEQLSLDQAIHRTDLLFIDSTHTESSVTQELSKNAPMVRKYLVFHDTETFGHRGELEGHRGIWYAISSYMRQHPEWCLLEHLQNNNGLTVFMRLKGFA